MKLDKNYSCVFICPETKEILLHTQVMYSDGVCPSCGHVKDGTITHSKKVVGKWNRPSGWVEYWKGVESVFIRKEDLL